VSDQPDSQHTRAQLDRSFLSGIAWTGAAKAVTQVLSWSATIFVARLLTPADYGVVAMATVVLGVIQLLSEFGVGTALVTRRDLSEQQVAQIGGFAVGVGILLMLIAFVLAKPIANFNNDARVAPVVAVLGVSFLISSFRTVPSSLLMRDLEFRKLAAIESIEAVFMTALTFGLAFGGLGYWALVLGQTISRAIGTMLAMFARRHRLAPPMPLAPIANELRFGGHVVASRVGWYVYNNADIGLVGRMLGTVALGSYSFAANLASIPVDRVYQLYSRVSGAVIARAQTDPASVRRYLLRITEAMSIASFPLAIGMGLVADSFAAVVLGNNWMGVVPVLRMLAIAAALRSLDPILAQVLISTGHPQKNARTMIRAAFAMPVLFLIGSRWGPTGVASAWVLAYPFVVLVPQVLTALRVSDATVGSYVTALWPAASGCVVMAGIVLAVRWAAGDTLTPASLAIQVSAGAAGYTATLWLLHRDRILAIRDTLIRFVNKPQRLSDHFNVTSRRIGLAFVDLFRL